MATVVPRSEQVAMEEQELLEWCGGVGVTIVEDTSQFPPDVADEVGETSRVGMMHFHGSLAWTWPSSQSLLRRPANIEPHTDFEVIPPWNPTLRDIEESLVNEWGDVFKDKVLPVMKIHRNLAVNSLDDPLLPEHIVHLKQICEEVEGELDEGDFEFEDDDDAYWPMDEEVLRIMHLEPRELFQGPEETKSDEVKGKCREGQEVIDSIMAKDLCVMTEGDYMKLCEIFKILHN